MEALLLDVASMAGSRWISAHAVCTGNMHVQMGVELGDGAGTTVRYLALDAGGREAAVQVLHQRIALERLLALDDVLAAAVARGCSQGQASGGQHRRVRGSREANDAGLLQLRRRLGADACATAASRS